MFILSMVHNIHSRLGIVMIFTSLFSIVFVAHCAPSLSYRLTAYSLYLCSEAKRIEIFTATAAFAAVQVVFVESVPTSGSDSINGTKLA